MEQKNKGIFRYYQTLQTNNVAIISYELSTSIYFAPAQ